VKVQGALTSISVGLDGTVGGITPDGNAVVRKDGDIEAEVNGSKTASEWTSLELPLQKIEIVNLDSVLFLDKSGQMGQEKPMISTGTIKLLQSSIITGGSVQVQPQNSVFLFTNSQQGTYSPEACVPITLDTKEIQLPNNAQSGPVNSLVSFKCKTGNFSKVSIKPCSQPTQQGGS